MRAGQDIAPCLCRHAADVVVHLSHDAWVEEEKLDLPMQHLGEEQAAAYGLRQGDHGAEWWAAEVDVLPYALVVDFVFSDAALRAWDNNGQQVGYLVCPMHCHSRPASVSCGKRCWW